MCIRDRTWGVGEISAEAQRLIDVTKQSFFEGIKFAKEGNHLYEISKAIQDYAEGFGYSIVRDLVGHGIGTHLHEDPQIPNFKPKGRGLKLQAGMTPVSYTHLDVYKRQEGYSDKSKKFCG